MLEDSDQIDLLMAFDVADRDRIHPKGRRILD